MISKREKSKSANTFFERWKGASIKFYRYTASLPHLELLVFRYGHKDRIENLLISVGGIHLSSFREEWSNIDLQLESLDNANGRACFRLSDISNDCEIKCEYFDVAENVRLK